LVVDCVVGEFDKFEVIFGVDDNICGVSLKELKNITIFVK